MRCCSCTVEKERGKTEAGGAPLVISSAEGAPCNATAGSRMSRASTEMKKQKLRTDNGILIGKKWKSNGKFAPTQRNLGDFSFLLELSEENFS